MSKSWLIVKFTTDIIYGKLVQFILSLTTAESTTTS